MKIYFFPHSSHNKINVLTGLVSLKTMHYTLIEHTMYTKHDSQLVGFTLPHGHSVMQLSIGYILCIGNFLQNWYKLHNVLVETVHMHISLRVVAFTFNSLSSTHFCNTASNHVHHLQTHTIQALSNNITTRLSHVIYTTRLPNHYYIHDYIKYIFSVHKH